jgi:hypothetical protein
VLGPDGLLPPGRHKWSVDKVREVLVDPFPDSPTRADIYQRWLDHRLAIETVVPIVRQLVDGSFVTNKPDPGDIDVVTVLDGEALDNLTTGEQLILAPLFQGHATRDVWSVDSFLVPEWPEGHVNRAASRKVEAVWVNRWGTVKGTTAGVKGFVVIES